MPGDVVSLEDHAIAVGPRVALVEVVSPDSRGAVRIRFLLYDVT